MDELMSDRVKFLLLGLGGVAAIGVALALGSEEPPAPVQTVVVTKTVPTSQVAPQPTPEPEIEPSPAAEADPLASPSAAAPGAASPAADPNAVGEEASAQDDGWGR